MVILKNKCLSLLIFGSISVSNSLYAQSESPNYEKIQSSYSIDYSHLKNLYVSFFYSDDENSKNNFLIDPNKETEDEQITVKEPLGYGLKLQTSIPQSEVKIGDINLEYKEKVDE